MSGVKAWLLQRSDRGEIEAFGAAKRSFMKNRHLATMARPFVTSQCLYSDTPSKSLGMELDILAARSSRGQPIDSPSPDDLGKAFGQARVAPDMERAIKRGAIVLTFDPLLITWRDRCVPLSPTEAQVYAHICRRGRTTYEELDQVLADNGANPATRSLVLGHIRGKFRQIGACCPFERLGMNMLRLRVDPDEHGSTAPVIGLTVPRYVTAS